MLAAKGLDDAGRQPALRVIARGVSHHLFFIRQLLVEQERIVPMKAPAFHIPAFYPLVGTKHRIILTLGGPFHRARRVGALVSGGVSYLRTSKFSMRRSGTNQRSATSRYKPWASQGE